MNNCVVCITVGLYKERKGPDPEGNLVELLRRRMGAVELKSCIGQTRFKPFEGRGLR